MFACTGKRARNARRRANRQLLSHTGQRSRNNDAARTDVPQVLRSNKLLMIFESNAGRADAGIGGAACMQPSPSKRFRATVRNGRQLVFDWHFQLGRAARPYVL